MHWWNLLNAAVFDSKLSTPRKVTVKGFRDTYGLCNPYGRKRGDVHMIISNRFHDKKSFLSVLVHEMVHQWQWTFVEEINRKNFDKLCHGKTFWQWKEPVNRILDLPLQLSYY